MVGVNPAGFAEIMFGRASAPLIKGQVFGAFGHLEPAKRGRDRSGARLPALQRESREVRLRRSGRWLCGAVSSFRPYRGNGGAPIGIACFGIGRLAVRYIPEAPPAKAKE